jgi:hypothetical protein
MVMVNSTGEVVVMLFRGCRLVVDKQLESVAESTEGTVSGMTVFIE